MNIFVRDLRSACLRPILFAKATNWKNYMSRNLRPFIKGRVIVVGAGLGSSTTYLCNRSHVRWLCLDPDANHVSHLKDLIAAQKLPPCSEARCGVLNDLAPGDRADTIIYVDVLEHIQDDDAELLNRCRSSCTGGSLWFSPQQAGFWRSFGILCGFVRNSGCYPFSS
jgi:2-polyprenyl-3-methyl-5-hydroxy-6-metoxy-1,4-benzoquinol methylase